jgi:hypothetical protein
VNTLDAISVKSANKIIWNRLNSSVGKEFAAKAKLDRLDRLKRGGQAGGQRLLSREASCSSISRKAEAAADRT